MPPFPTVTGKFLRCGTQRLWIKGVAYGTFAPATEGGQFPSREQVADDFAMMARHGINTVRTYTAPDPAILDEAARQELRVMVGLPWAQHVAFLDDRRLRAQIRRETIAEVRRLASHPALLLFALGNEIPAPVVRWHGAERVEHFLRELYDEAKSTSPDSLFTYVNYPPTEYLDLSFVDLFAFNVYLHRKADLHAYVARLQKIAAHKPLLLAEAGADSLRESEDGQAALTAMQLRAAFAEGACGAIAFTWTDEWWRGGSWIEDWAFGLVDRARGPKPALEAVARAFNEAPFPEAERRTWPRVSVVVCAYNAADTLDECLTSLEHLTYPDVEIIVVNDGSTDATGAIAQRHAGVTRIEVPNGGLSVARNIGLQAATGEIVAYTDADVRVDPDWLTYLVQPFLTTDVAGAGGPNVVPPDDPWVAQCVARAPGGPTHVLLDDRIAEHVPGCNMAFRRDALLAIGGFNPIYLRAGDDVDVCWRLQARGWKVGFAAAALVWHRHRPSVRQYWRQQVGYGEGQVWLRPHHPDKFVGGRIQWRGHIYSPLPFLRALSRPTVNTGVWGSAAFPSVYQTHVYPFAFWPHSARWQAGSLALLVAGLALALFPAGAWGGALLATGAFGLSVTAIRCVRYALASRCESLCPPGRQSGLTSRVRSTALIAWLHFIQPLARARGRIRGRLNSSQIFTPAEWRALRAHRPSMADLWRTVRLLPPRGRTACYWSEQWLSAETLLTQFTERLRRSPLARIVEIDDGWQSDWDVRVGTGRWPWPGVVDLRVLVENHAAGRCLVRVTQRVRLHVLPWAIAGVAAAGIASVVRIPGLQASLAVPSVVPGLFALAAAGAVLWATARQLAAMDRAMDTTVAALDLLPLGRTPAAGRPAAPALGVEPLADAVHLADNRRFGQPPRGRAAPAVAPEDTHRGSESSERRRPHGPPLPPIALRPLRMKPDDLRRAGTTRGEDLRARQ